MCWLRCHETRSSASLFLPQQGKITFGGAQNTLNPECNESGACEVWNTGLLKRLF